VHWRIERRGSWGASFCGSIDSVKGHKGKENYCIGRTIIHRNAVDSIVSHKGVDNGRSTTKGNGDEANVKWKW
jgi:hypothetical protein